MLVQSCLNAFLATVWRLRTAPAPLPESCSAASCLGLRAVCPQRPYRLIVRLSLGPRAARPASRLFFRAHVPFVFFIFTAGTARGELTLCSTTSLHNYVSTLLLRHCRFVLLGNLTSIAPYRPELNVIG